jgi:hypothetical protein
VELDSIEQLVPFGAMRVKVGFERPAYIAARDTNAVVRLDGVDYNLFSEFLTAGTDHTLEMDDVQTVDGGRRRYTWLSWSNGQARAHTFTASSAGDTIVADVAAEFRIRATALGAGGSVSADAPLDLSNGTLLPEDSIVRLTATLDSTQYVFEGWAGPDTVATTDTLTLQMHRPFTVEAVFAAPLAVSGDAIPNPVMGTPYAYQLTASGGVGGESWELMTGDLPLGMSLSGEGFLTGTPEVTGDFPLGVQVTSGSQTFADEVLLTVVAPPLTVADVLKELARLGDLTPQEENYLDLLGNRNGAVDIGDFLAWVEETGGTVTAQEVQAAVAALEKAKTVKGRPPR